MIYNEGTPQQPQREMRRRHRHLQSQDRSHMQPANNVATNISRHCFLRRVSQSCLPPHYLSRYLSFHNRSPRSIALRFRRWPQFAPPREREMEKQVRGHHQR